MFCTGPLSENRSGGGEAPCYGETQLSPATLVEDIPVLTLLSPILDPVLLGPPSEVRVALPLPIRGLDPQHQTSST